MKYFNYDEFDSPDMPGSGHNMEDDFLQMLDKAREVSGIPYVITSGFRTEDYNDSLNGSVADSSHLHGCAADIACTTSRDRFLIITGLLAAGFDRIGIADDFIHVDNDWEKPEAVAWVYY